MPGILVFGRKDDFQANAHRFSSRFVVDRRPCAALGSVEDFVRIRLSSDAFSNGGPRRSSIFGLHDFFVLTPMPMAGPCLLAHLFRDEPREDGVPAQVRLVGLTPIRIDAGVLDFEDDSVACDVSVPLGTEGGDVHDRLLDAIETQVNPNLSRPFLTRPLEHGASFARTDLDARRFCALLRAIVDLHGVGDYPRIKIACAFTMEDGLEADHLVSVRSVDRDGRVLASRLAHEARPRGDRWIANGTTAYRDQWHRIAESYSAAREHADATALEKARALTLLEEFFAGR